MQKSDLERLQDQQAREVLLRFLQDVAVKRCEAKATYLIPLQEYPRDIERPQVFFSYAWGNQDDPAFQGLQAFLKELAEDFEQAGVRVWLDLSRMIGNVEDQMRDGVNESNLILLMGTHLYAEKIKTDPPRNVRKELEYSIERSRNIYECSLVPLVLEGTASAIFPDLEVTQLWQDASPCLQLDSSKSSPIQNMQAYITTLTSLQPLGLLAGVLGLHRTDNHPKYRQALKKSYTRSLRLLEKELAEIYTNTGPISKKSFVFSIPKISFKDLAYDREKNRMGQGSFGTVYQGSWQNIPVAIKEIQGTLTEESTADFKTEAEAMTKANSPWVVSLYGIAQEGQRAALVMELMPKGSLYELLHNNQPLSWELRYQIATDIAAGLLSLHGKKILHRDLKSGNILLDDRLRAKLSDFGLSKIKSTSRAMTTRRAQAVGTDSWMAPELFLDLDDTDDEDVNNNSTERLLTPYSEKSDIYAYAIVLWEIASGKMPYAGVSGTKIEKWVKQGKREKIPTECPAPFVTLIQSGWKQKPEERLELPIIIEELRTLSAQEAQRIATEQQTTQQEQKGVSNTQGPKGFVRFEVYRFTEEKNLPQRLKKIQEALDAIPARNTTVTDIATEHYRLLLTRAKQQVNAAIEAAQWQFQLLLQPLASRPIEQRITGLTVALQILDIQQTIDATSTTAHSDATANAERQAHYRYLITEELARQDAELKELKAAQLFEAQHLQKESDLTQRLAKIETALNTANKIATEGVANEETYRSLLMSAQSQASATIKAAKQEFQTLLKTLPPETNINGRIAELQKAAQVPSKSTDSAQHTYYQSLVAQELAAQQQKLAEQARATVEAARLVRKKQDDEARALIRQGY